MFAVIFEVTFFCGSLEKPQKSQKLELTQILCHTVVGLISLLLNFIKTVYYFILGSKMWNSLPLSVSSSPTFV